MDFHSIQIFMKKFDVRDKILSYPIIKLLFFDHVDPIRSKQLKTPKKNNPKNPDVPVLIIALWYVTANYRLSLQTGGSIQRTAVK